ncbi:MAG TPA: type IV pilin protein [Gammaproteobacteria bacterium]|nr:type IV pilin protein [Gammaproteobacteria bacterium]
MRKLYEKGFTLVELMIVVAIIAIIAAIAYPSYRKSVIKSDRSDAKVALQRAAQALERCYAEGHNYKSTPTATPSGTCPAFPQASPNQYYTISLPTVTTTTYTIEAVPTADSPQQDDDECAKFFLDNTGLQTSKNASNATTTDCW